LYTDAGTVSMMKYNFDSDMNKAQNTYVSSANNFLFALLQYLLTQIYKGNFIQIDT